MTSQKHVRTDTQSLNTLTCREKARSAGIGMRAAMKKAVTLLMEVRATLAPVLFKHSPVRSCRRERCNKITEAKHSLSDFHQKANE